MRTSLLLALLFPAISLAQYDTYDSTSGANDTGLAAYMVGLFLGFIIMIFVTRAIFSIGEFIKYQKAQVNLLAKIARKHGVNESDINGILFKANLKEYISKNESNPDNRDYLQEKLDSLNKKS